MRLFPSRTVPTMTAADDDDKGKGKEMVEDEEEEEKFAESMIMEKIEVAYVGGAELAEENIVVDVVEDTLANGGTSTTPGDHEDADVASCSGGANIGDEGDDGIVDGDGSEGGNDDNNDDEENLDDLLENLDIDGDFECWESMKKGTSGENENEGEEQGAATSKSAVDSPTDENIAGKNVGDNNDAAAASDESRPPSPSTVLQQNLQKWKDRLEREEVYSRLYRPSSAERSELQELETHLDMNPKRGLRTLFVRTNSTGGGRNVSPANRMAWNLLLHPEDQQQQQQNQETAAPAATATVNHSFPSSILLKRGPVSFGEQGNNEQALVDGEAILLTRGFVLAKKMATDAGSSSKKNVASSHSSLHRAILWQNVTFVEPVAGDDMSWTLTIQKNSSNDTVGAGATAGGATIRTRTTSSGGGSASSDDQDDHSANNNNSNNNSEHHDDNNFHNTIAQQQEITFVCDSLAERDAWLEAMERVLIPHHLHNSNNNQNATGTSSSLISVTELGWQYKLVHRPAFTMAVTGMVADMVLPPPEVLDKLDKYNELTALHYAVRLDMTTSIRRLLDAGADPNIKDADGRTCMYYAVRDELPSTTIDLLKEYGAKESQLAKMETKGELFGRVQATEQVRKDRRETQQRQEAVEAQVKMNENLRLLNERGEKIEDLGNKASELNANASNFVSMAKQLKEKSKKQSKWLPFL